MSIKNASILIFAAFTLFSCTERIEIDTAEEFVRLVVDGSLSTERMEHTVKLTTTADYFSGQPAPVVSGATVTITDGSTVHILRETSPGIYRTTPGVSAVPGHSYTLRIRLTSPIGGHAVYTAESVAPLQVPLDSIQLEFHPDYSDEGMWEARGFFPDPALSDFYRFMPFRNGKLITYALSDWYVTNDYLFRGQYVNGWTVAFLHQHRQDEAFRTGDVMTIRMDHISREYAGFVQGAQTELRGSFPLFSGPPANVKGNISNGAIGFFAVYASSRASAVVP